MSKWSQAASSKFSDKQQLEKLSREIFESDCGGKTDSIFDVFEKEVKDFNADSGNKGILSFDHTPGHAAFSVTRKGSGMYLQVVMGSPRGQININGGGGLEFKDDIFIVPDTAKKTCYFADVKSRPIDIDEAVHKSLEALLEI